MGRERRPKAGACFYENINYGGRYFCVRPPKCLCSPTTTTTAAPEKFRRDVGDVHGLWRDSIESIHVG